MCDCSSSSFYLSSLGETILPVSQPYQIPNIATIIAYGFGVNLLDASSNGTPSFLYSRSGHGVDEDGLGLSVDLLSDHEIDINHFIQLDFADLIRKQSLKCGPPTMTIGSIQINEGFVIYGSNTLGLLGNLLYSFTNTSGIIISKTIVVPSYETDFVSIKKYGLMPYRYISVRGLLGNVVLTNVVFSYCDCCK